MRVKLHTRLNKDKGVSKLLWCNVRKMHRKMLYVKDGGVK